MRSSRCFLLFSVFLPGVLGMSGCSLLATTDSDASAPAATIPVPANAPGHSNNDKPPATASPDKEPAVVPATVCHSAAAHLRICDLTQPWRDRICLLPDGGTCRPGGIR
jgi:hypothetical protein